MKVFFYISVPLFLGIAAAVHGSNNTDVGYGTGLGSFDFVVSDATQINSTAFTVEQFQQLHSPTGYKIGGSAEAAQDQKSWKHSLPTLSSYPSLLTRNPRLVKGRIAPQVDSALDFESPNISQSKPWPVTPRTNAADSHSGLDHLNSSAAGNGDYPPPKPPSPKSYGKRPWNPSWDCDDENSVFGGCLCNWNPSSMTDSSFSTWLYAHLRILARGISTTPDNDGPEDSSSWEPASITALTGAALYLATTHSSGREKKKRRTSLGETIATSAKRAEPRSAVSEGHICNHCEASTSTSSRTFSRKPLEPLGNQEPIVIWSNSGSIGQPETRPISQEKLFAEVQCIYAGLVDVEGKCIAAEFESERSPNFGNGWKALIDLHRSLFRKRHDLLTGARGKSNSPYTYSILHKYVRPIPSWYNPMLGHLASNQMITDAQDEQDEDIWTAIARHWYSKTVPHSTTEDSERMSDFEDQPELWRTESYNVGEHTNLESKHAKLGVMADSVDVSVENGYRYEGSIDTDFASSVSSQSDACGGTIGSAPDSLQLEYHKNSFHHDFPYLLDVPESVSQMQLSPGSDTDALLESWNLSSSERNLTNPISMENSQDYLIDITPDSRFEQDEDWLQSFVDLEVCSHDYSDLASEVTSLESLIDQPKLPIPSGSATHAEIATYVEPQLTVMSQWNLTNSELQESHTTSIFSSSTEIDGLKIIGPSPILHPPASLLDTPLLHVNPSKTSASPRKGVLKECQYCHKSFSPSELRKHIRYHTRPVSCPEPDCEYSCANDRDLRRHHVTNHGVAQKQNCPILDCNITFTRKYNLLRHIRRVHGSECSNDAEADLKA